MGLGGKALQEARLAGLAKARAVLARKRRARRGDGPSPARAKANGGVVELAAAHAAGSRSQALAFIDGLIAEKADEMAALKRCRALVAGKAASENR